MMAPRGHADGGGGDEALEVGRSRRWRRRRVSPELRRRLRRLLDCRRRRTQRRVLFLLLVEEVAAGRGAVEAISGAGSDAGDGHGGGGGAARCRRVRKSARNGLGIRVSRCGSAGCERGELRREVAAWSGGDGEEGGRADRLRRFALLVVPGGVGACE